MTGFSIGLSALRAAQFGLNVTGQNIANANTPGYHRQIAEFVNSPSVRLSNLEFGTGVDVNQIRRIQFRIVEETITTNISARGDLESRLAVTRQVESLIIPGTGSLPDRIDALWNRFEELSAQPFDSNSRTNLISSAEQLTSSLRQLTVDLDRISTQADLEINSIVDRVNTLTRDIVDLNVAIKESKAAGSQPNDLLDHRDTLVNELAEYVDVRLDPHSDTVLVADGVVLVGQNYPRELGLTRDQNGLHLIVGAEGTPIPVRSGQLGGLLATRNEQIPSFLEHLDDLAQGLIAAIDQQHAQGVGIRGGLERVFSRRPVDDVTAAFNTLDFPIPVTQGTLFVGVTDESTGERIVHQIPVDPSIHSTDSLASSIDAIANLQAVTNAQTGELTIVADTGYRFDFAPQIGTHPTSSTLTGTSAPTFDGIYTGGGNDDLRFVFLNSGEVGVTEDLQVQVLDAFGNEIDVLDVGQGYAAGTPLALENGLEVSLSAGTVIAGEDFTTTGIANADTSGVLAALGLNTLFTGSDARTLEVNRDILEDSDLLATSITGLAGDSGNLTRIIARRELTVIGDSRSVEQFAAQFVSIVGSEVSSLQTATENLDLLNENLVAQRDSVSGVDPNEEAVRMLQYQTAFQAAARFIDAVDQTTQGNPRHPRINAMTFSSHTLPHVSTSFGSGPKAHRPELGAPN